MAEQKTAQAHLTITDITDGVNSNIWTTSTAPTTPNYTFTISNLTGADNVPRVGDIILQGIYRYTITSVGSTTVLAGFRQSLQGATGTAGKWYSGTGITGTSTTAAIFSGSGVSSAVVGDMYLNTSTDNVYQCTTAGNTSTAKWKYVGNIKGSTGKSVSSVVTEYYQQLSGAAAPTSSSTGSTTIPNYVSGCTYYTRTITNFDSGNPNKSEWVANAGLTNEIKNAYDAWVAAGAAELKVAKIIENSEGMIVTSGINGGDVTPGTTSTYGYNTLMAPNYLGLRYNAINLAKLTTTETTPALEFYIPTVNGSGVPTQGNKGLSITGDSLIFYRPSTSSQGTKGMELDATTLKFYDATGAVAQATFGGTQATISGTINVYDGKIGNNANNYWYIGNYTDYNQNNSAIIKSKGTASIQLDETNTWRISTNRIHTAWAPETGDDAFLLHYPKFNDSSSNNKYWDYGLHLPTSNSDKFLYIRNASGSETLDNLLNDLDDYGYNYWTYKFYIDGEGNIHAGDIYSHDTLISGTSAPYLLKSGGTITGALEVNGALTKGGKNVAYLTATPTNGQILIADGTSGGIKTSGYTIAKSVPSDAAFTDKNVQTSQANTTKIFLAGTSTSGTSTGTLSYDSNVYLTTTAGVLHATTFEGNLSGTATKANQDGDGNVIKTTYLKLSGGNVTGAVSFGSSVLADELTVGDLVVNGAASFTNNIQANTINGVEVGSSPKFTDNNTTYTFSNGTNGFTVTPSGGEAQTVTVTPSISNNITGTGTRTSGYLVKFSGTNTITNGPAIGTGTTKFLREDGTWVVPGGTYSLPTATSSVLGGVKVGSGLSISDGVLSHTDTSSQASSSNSGRTYIQSITLDTYGHVTGLTTASESVTDTHYTTHLYAGKSDGNANAATTNGNTYLMVLDNTTVRDRRKISGSGAASVTSDVNGNITINSPVAITSVSFANGTITFTKSDSTTIPITTDNFVITQASGATALVKLKSGSTTEYEGYSAGGATTAPVYFDEEGHPVAVTSIPASLISGSVTPTSHNHSQIITVGNQRSTATTPNDYVNALIFKGLKNKATIGSPSSDNYSYLIGLRGWSDSSGGRSHEIAFNNTGIFVRQESSSTANTWGSWYQIYTTGNKPTKSDVGLGSVDNTADANKRVKGVNITTTANAVAYYTDTVGTFGSKASANGVLYATSANGALNWGTLPIAQGGTGKTTALAAITNLGGPYILAGGTEITASSNLDTDYTAVGTYYSSNSTRSASLSGTVVSTDSGFKMITMKGYRDQNILQFANWNDERLLYRYSNAATVSFGKWYQLVRLPSGSDNKTFAAIGGSTQPVYVNSSGVVTACTSYANATVGKSNKTGAADLTTTANAIAYYTDTAGTFGSKASANGALYATSANGALNWGTLPVAQGGTGLTASPSMLTNLGSTTAANVLQASPRPGITGTLGAANGGTGQTSLINAANSLLNALSTGGSTPADADYYISQYVNGGTTTTTYHRRPMSALWSYISGKISSSGTYVTVNTNQTLTAAGTKTYLGLQTYGSNGITLGVTSGTSVTQKANIKYDSTLEAIVFSFA